MIKPFDFYFDFVSPYSFLAHKEIKKIEIKASMKVRYKPILLGGSDIWNKSTSFYSR